MDIRRVVNDEIREIAVAIDKEFREDKISHDVWDRLHLLACEKMSTAGDKAVHEIEVYERNYS